VGVGGRLRHEYDCLVIDLPGHGATVVGGPGQSSGLHYSMHITAQAVRALEEEREGGGGISGGIFLPGGGSCC
jgi:pimeloyl-ACP methyl ester carboxylesterase